MTVGMYALTQNIKHMKLKWSLIFLVALLAGGCGYHLVGKETSLPPHLKTMVIPLFGNSTQEPELQRDLTSIIRESFINDGRLKIVGENKADLLMKGVLFQYELRPISFDRQDIAVEYWVILGVDIEVIDQVKKKTYVKQKFTTKWDYKASAVVANSEASRQLALSEAYRDLASRLVSIVIEKF